jgi:hypothetical protein
VLASQSRSRHMDSLCGRVRSDGSEVTFQEFMARTILGCFHSNDEWWWETAAERVARWLDDICVSGTVEDAHQEAWAELVRLQDRDRDR